MVMPSLINGARNGEVVFDLSRLGTEITAVTLPRAVLARISRAGLGVVINLNNGEIALAPADAERLVRWSFNRNYQTTNIRFEIDARNDQYSVVSSSGPRINNFGTLSGTVHPVQRALAMAELVAIKEDDEIEEVDEEQNVA